MLMPHTSDFSFPNDTGGIRAAGVLTYEPEFDQVIERGAKALAPGRKWVILDYKMPSNWLRCLAPLFVALGSKTQTVKFPVSVL